jgi:purine-nucleoside phosphorylase
VAHSQGKRDVIDPAVCPPAFIERACDAIRGVWSVRPRTAVILGSGLGNVTSGLDIEVELAYHKLPHYPRSTALGHAGRLLCGSLEGTPLVVMSGRFHLYEGYHETEIALPICVLAALGVETLIVTNASGGLNPRFASGDVMAIADHINLLSPGPRALAWSAQRAPFQADRRPYYDSDLIDAAQRVARREDFVCQRGVYIGVSGPNYETRAEYRFLRRIGGDAVGMSTVPEAITARHLGLRVLGLSIITNVACPDGPARTTPEEVCRLAALAEPHVRAIIRDVATRAPHDRPTP